MRKVNRCRVAGFACALLATMLVACTSHKGSPANPPAPVNKPPQVNAGPDQTITLPASATLKGTVTDDGLPAGKTLSTSWTKQSGPGSITFANAAAVNTTVTFSEPGTYVLRLTANDSALTGSDDLTVTVNPVSTTLPPDPATVAPPIDPTVVTTLGDATAFLYTGPKPIQTGVAPGTINPVRVAVIRGRVLDKTNKPLPGVTMTILNHPEFGQTLSRADGRFDLAVNGGGPLTISYVKTGYLSVHRQVQAPWQDYVMVEDAILIQQDTKVTAINLADTSQAFQVAQGSVVTDKDGTRQATLLIPQGTQAQVYNPDGTTRAVSSLTLRLTEYTVGDNGPTSMPAPLPPTSAYTYAFEMKAEEAAVKRNGKDVLFDRAVPVYIHNFLNFPVGMAVPVGYYDQDQGAWVPSDNGTVIKILTVNKGTVTIDSDGDGVADDQAKLTALGLTAQEQARLANLYQAGQTLWRVPVKHLSTWDCNWPYKMPDDAVAPTNLPPYVDPTEDDPDCKGGSIIECQNQILRESLPLTGTGLTLHYASNRVLGRTARNTAVIALTGATLPASVKRVYLQIDLAGRHSEQSFGPQPNQRYTLTWDGLDAFGRKVIGSTVATIRIGYVYAPVYATPAQIGAAFARFSGVPLEGSAARNEIRIWQEFVISLGVLSTPLQTLASWTLSIHHRYDPIDKTLYLGTGGRRHANAEGVSMITTVAGTGIGSGDAFDAYFGGDGGPATAADLTRPNGVALGPDGRLYIADTKNFRIRKVSPDGIITTVAGNGVLLPNFTGDGGPAAAASLAYPEGVAIGPDGDLYIADWVGNRIRRVSSMFPGFGVGDVTIASTDGMHLYRFDANGQHLQTLHVVTGAVLYQFTYDPAGRLTAVKDAEGNVTTIERDSAGNPTAIVAPFSQRTRLTLDANGYLASMTNPAGEAYRMTYTQDGLLTAFKDPKGNAALMSYDPLGRLKSDTDAAGGAQTLTRTETDRSYTVNLKTSLGRATTYLVEQLTTGATHRRTTDPDGTTTDTLIGTDGSRKTTLADGTVINLLEGPDPRFGMQASIPTSLTTTTGGLTSTRSMDRTVSLDSTKPLSLASQTETLTLNDRIFKSVYDAATKTTTNTSAAGRLSTVTTDNLGRVVQSQITGLAATTIAYDPHGRLATITRGRGAHEPRGELFVQRPGLSGPAH